MPKLQSNPSISQAMDTEGENFKSKTTQRNPLPNSLDVILKQRPQGAPRPRKKNPKTRTNRHSIRSSTRSECPFVSREELSAHYSRSPDKDSSVGNRVRLARITKHQLIMEKINNKKLNTVRKSRKEKEKQRKMIVGRRNKIMEENRRKMLEVQWRLKLAKISTHIHKDRIRNIKWKIGGDWGNKELRGIKRRTSNFEEKNYIWRTTKNVKYTISRCLLLGVHRRF